jgi:AcrR family transcriptional regulator
MTDHRETRYAGRVRPSAAQIDRAILDITAGLVARRGLKETAVQAIADEAGYSKAGILSRFRTKELLIRAAIEQCLEQTRDALANISRIRVGAERDAAAIRELTSLALARPGWGELVLAAVSGRRTSDVDESIAKVASTLVHMFDGEENSESGLVRRAHVTGAIAALIVLSLTYDGEATTEQARPLIHQTCWSALGHPAGFPAV